MKTATILVFAVAGTLLPYGPMRAEAQQTHRVIASTDLGGEPGDPDDIQSLYRLIHYSDILRVEGIVSSLGSPGAHPNVSTLMYWIKRVDVEAMRRRGHPELMTEDQLMSAVRQGLPSRGGPGPRGTSPASRLIIERAHAGDPEKKNRPLWLLAWGGLTDIAQAIHDDPSIVPKIRIYSIGSRNTVGEPESRQFLLDGMKTGKWPRLWWIENGTMPEKAQDTFKGIHQGGNQEGEWHNVRFVDVNIRGFGGDHNGLFPQVSGDAFPLARFGPSQFNLIKEGDSPTMLFLLSPVLGGVGNVDDPTKESWGGQFRHFDRRRFPNYYVDLGRPAEDCWKTINKWRVAYLGDWKKRWRWYGPRRGEASRD